MVDIKRSGDSNLVLRVPALKRKHLAISISERENQIKGLHLLLEKMKTVDMKRIELQIDTLTREIEDLKDELGNEEKKAENEILEH